MKILNIVILLILAICFEKKFCMIDKILNQSLSISDLCILGMVLMMILCFIIERKKFYKNFPLSYDKFVKDNGKPLEEFHLFLKYRSNKTRIYKGMKGVANICVFKDCVILKLSNRAVLINSNNLVLDADLPVFTNFALRIDGNVYYFKSLSETSSIIEVLKTYVL